MSWTTERARLAAAKRHHPEADHSDLERDLAAARLELAAQRVADGLPPLSDEQRARIAVLLVPALAEAPAGLKAGDGHAA